jgi:hypothetical protein
LLIFSVSLPHCNVRIYARDTHATLSALIGLCPGSWVSQNFNLNKNRAQGLGGQVTLSSILNTFLEIEQKPALATLKKISLTIEAREEKNAT